MSEGQPFLFRWGDDAGVRAWSRAVMPGATIVLHHGADDRWLELDAPERFGAWADHVAERVPSCRSWVSIAELNRWPVERYVRASRLATGHLLRALDHQLAGHLLASAALRARDAGATVAPGLVLDGRAYELHDLLLDVIAAPTVVARDDLGAHLRRRRAAFEAAAPAATPRQRLVRRLAASAIPLEQALPRAIAAAYETVPVPA